MNDVKLLNKAADNIRILSAAMVEKAKSGHPGGSLSIADILTVLYFEEMNIKVEDPRWEDRDRFVLSKGHAAPGLYAALAERGYFPKEELKSLRKFESILQGHPDMKKTPGVDMSTGSLGQGISAAVGMAMANKLGKNTHRVYALLGDGECEEGQVWEAAMAAAHYKLDNLCAIIDFNGLQIDGDIHQVMNPTPLDEKFAAFGWHVICIDGHNLEEIRKAYQEAKEIKGQPTVIVAKTIKGKGVSFMENQASWHGVAPSEEEAAQAIKEIEEA